MATLLPNGKQFYVTNAGLPLVGGKLETYDAGTSNPRQTFTDAAGAVPQTNPVILDARGEATIFWSGTYKVILKDSAGVTIWTQDNLTSSDFAVDLLRAQLLNSAGAANLGANIVGFIRSDTGAVALTVQNKLLEIASVMDFIPVAQHAAIKAYTSTYDATADFNEALAACKVLKVPAGQYRILRPLNMTGRRDASGQYSHRHLIGEGASVTFIDAYTGVYPCVDCTGSDLNRIEGINFRSDNPTAGLVPADCASIGIMIRRGNTTQQNNQCVLEDIRINLTSDMTRNAGTGTVGIINCGAEHQKADMVQIYANLPMVIHNVLVFAVSSASNIPVFGVEYEQPYAGASISCTIMEYRSMQLIAYDSFRALWIDAGSGVTFKNLYTSTRKLVSLVPAYAETFKFTDATNIFIDCYQEVSGLFGATYRQDHSYATWAGVNTNVKLTVERGALDMGFTMPGAAVAAYQMLNNAYLNGCVLDCNYLIGIYNASGDNCGFAAELFTVTGVINAMRNTKVVGDCLNGRLSGYFGTPISPSMFNCEFVCFLSGVSYWGHQEGSWTPVAIGLAVAGVGTYTFQAGSYTKMGRICTFTGEIVLTNHTGTGGLAITGLPFLNDVNIEAAISVEYSTLLATAGLQVTASIPNGQSRILINKCDPGGAAMLAVQVDTTVAKLTFSGSYRIKDGV